MRTLLPIALAAVSAAALARPATAQQAFMCQTPAGREVPVIIDDQAKTVATPLRGDGPITRFDDQAVSWNSGDRSYTFDRKTNTLELRGNGPRGLATGIKACRLK